MKKITNNTQDIHYKYKYIKHSKLSITSIKKNQFLFIMRQIHKIIEKIFHATLNIYWVS